MCKTKRETASPASPSIGWQKRWSLPAVVPGEASGGTGAREAGPLQLPLAQRGQAFPREGGLPPSFLSTPRRLPSGEGPCVCPPHPLDQDCLQQRKRLVQLCFPDAWHRARRTGCRASSGNSGTQESLAPGDAEGRGEFPAGPPRAGFSASTVLPFSRQSRLGISLPFLCLRGMSS